MENLEAVKASLMGGGETELREEVNATVEMICNANYIFVTGFARLGSLLNQVRKSKVWEDWGYESFGQYIKEIEGKIKQKRSTIYNTISVSENLLPYTDEVTIEAMGITKATELAKIVKATGSAPTPEILEHATDSEITHEEFRAELHEKFHIQKLDKGSFYDLKGFFCTPEERQELDYVFDLAAKVDPPIPEETSEWERRKQVMFRLIQEFRATYEGNVQV